MNILKDLYEGLPSLVVTLAVIAVVVLVLWAANWFLLRRDRHLGEQQKCPRGIVMGAPVLLGCIVVLLVVPVGDDIRLSVLAIGDEVNRHLCGHGARRMMAALFLDVFARTVEAYAELGGEWLNHVASHQE